MFKVPVKVYQADRESALHFVDDHFLHERPHQSLTIGRSQQLPQGVTLVSIQKLKEVHTTTHPGKLAEAGQYPVGENPGQG